MNTKRKHADFCFQVFSYCAQTQRCIRGKSGFESKMLQEPCSSQLTLHANVFIFLSCHLERSQGFGHHGAMHAGIHRQWRDHPPVALTFTRFCATCCQGELPAVWQQKPLPFVLVLSVWNYKSMLSPIFKLNFEVLLHLNLSVRPVRLLLFWNCTQNWQ